MINTAIFLQTTLPTETATVVEGMGKISDWALTHGIRVVLIIVIAWLLKIISKKFVNRLTHVASKSNRLNINEGELKRMSTVARLFNWTINIIIILISTMMVLKELSVDIAPILAGAGILGVAIGFGGQYLVRDIISGFFIIFENQYRIGDVVTIGGISGGVEDITLRMTTLRDLDGTVHYIPHGEIKTVSNQTKQFSKINVNIGVSYDSNIDHVKTVVNNVGKQLAEDKDWKKVITEAPKFLRIDSFGDSSVNIKIVGVTKPSEQWNVAGELRKRIKEAFDAEGIEIPFTQCVIHYAKATGTEKNNH
jgi:small conductance mechanosensitive channel